MPKGDTRITFDRFQKTVIPPWEGGVGQILEQNFRLSDGLTFSGALHSSRHTSPDTDYGEAEISVAHPRQHFRIREMPAILRSRGVCHVSLIEALWWVIDRKKKLLKGGHSFEGIAFLGVEFEGYKKTLFTPVTRVWEPGRLAGVDLEQTSHFAPRPTCCISPETAFLVRKFAHDE